MDQWPQQTFAMIGGNERCRGRPESDCDEGHSGRRASQALSVAVLALAAAGCARANDAARRDLVSTGAALIEVRNDQSMIASYGPGIAWNSLSCADRR